jgi:hypothetical protein
MSQVVDPITSPEAYRRTILAALGDDDPLTVQGEGPALARALVAEAGDLVRVPPEPREWSVLECIGHIVDSEYIAAVRYRWILAEDEPDIVGYDQDRWVSGLHHVEDDPDLLLATYAALRASNLDLWRRRPEEDRERIGRHRERGPESYGLTFRLVAGHDRVHLGQARRALETLRAR